MGMKAPNEAQTDWDKIRAALITGQLNQRDTRIRELEAENAMLRALELPSKVLEREIRLRAVARAADDTCSGDFPDPPDGKLTQEEIVSGMIRLSCLLSKQREKLEALQPGDLGEGAI